MSFPKLCDRDLFCAGAQLTPDESAGVPSLQEILAAFGEHLIADRFDWTTAPAVPAATDLASGIELLNAIRGHLKESVYPCGYKLFCFCYPCLSVDDEGAEARFISELNILHEWLNCAFWSSYWQDNNLEAETLAEGLTLIEAIRASLGLP